MIVKINQQIEIADWKLKAIHQYKDNQNNQKPCCEEWGRKQKNLPIKMDGIIHFILNLNVILFPVLVSTKELTNSFASSELEQNQQQPTFKVSALRLQMEEKGKPPYLEGYKEGPHSLISDSLFSLIIFIYVSVTFLYMFYAFCWRDEHPEQNRMQISQQTQDIDIDDSDEEGKIQVTAA